MIKLLTRPRAALRYFVRDETAAISVDWVTLTAAIIAMVLLGVATIEGSVEEIASWIAERLSNTDVG